MKSSSDVIAISSDSEGETDDRGSNRNNKAGDDSGNSKALLSPSQKLSALLFRCHVCNAEITCRSGAHHLIQIHYKDAHNIHNIELVKQTGPNGESLLNVMEMPIRPSATNPVLAPRSAVVRATNQVLAPRSAVKPVSRHNGAMTHPNILSHKPIPLQPTNIVQSYLPSSHAFNPTLDASAQRNYAGNRPVASVLLCVKPVSLVDNEVICLD